MDAISGIAVLGDRTDLFGSVASMPTTWRVLDQIDAAHLAGFRSARASARARARAAGAAPAQGAQLCLGVESRQARGVAGTYTAISEAAAKRMTESAGFDPVTVSWVPISGGRVAASPCSACSEWTI